MANGIFLKEVGQRIRALRKARNMTIAQMSEKTNINTVSLTYLEKGTNNSRILTLKAVADSLGVDVKDLIEGL